MENSVENLELAIDVAPIIPDKEKNSFIIPWENREDPAAEAQAIDRCYRIGQDKHVMAYKIVCRDSVEEHILALQESKKRISEGLILDETNLMKSISKEELLKLFE